MPRLDLVPGAVAAAVAASAAVGLAGAQPATVTSPVPPASPSRVDPAPTSASTVIASTYRVISPAGPAAFPDQGFTLTPIVDSPPPVTAARAYTIARDSGPLPLASDVSGTGTASFYAYSNSAAGTINEDGSVTLEYQATPAWVFSFPLSHYIQNSVGGAGLSGRGFPIPTGSRCSLVSVVDASKLGLIEAFEFCEHWTS